jgi:hypothetical protein
VAFPFGFINNDLKRPFRPGFDPVKNTMPVDQK